MAHQLHVKAVTALNPLIVLMLGLTHSCFVLDDGGEWTLNRPLPESNGWNASSCFPTPGR
jgi:hypothetical protein